MIVKIRNVIIAILLPTILIVSTMMFCVCMLNNNTIGFDNFANKINWMVCSVMLIAVSWGFSLQFIYDGLKKGNGKEKSE